MRLREEAEVVEGGGKGAGLDAVDDLHDLVVHRGGATDFAAVGADSTVDGIDLGFLAALKILKHTGLQTGVLADGYRDDHKGDELLHGIAVIQKLDYILALDRLDGYAALTADINAFLDQGLHDLP